MTVSFSWDALRRHARLLLTDPLRRSTQAPVERTFEDFLSARIFAPLLFRLPHSLLARATTRDFIRDKSSSASAVGTPASCSFRISLRCLRSAGASGTALLGSGSGPSDMLLGQHQIGIAEAFPRGVSERSGPTKSRRVSGSNRLRVHILNGKNVGALKRKECSYEASVLCLQGPFRAQTPVLPRPRVLLPPLRGRLEVWPVQWDPSRPAR